MLNPRAYYPYAPPYQWLDNEDESIILKDSEGKEIDKTPVLSDTKDDNRCWVRKDSEWDFEVKEEFEKPTPMPTPASSPIPSFPHPESFSILVFAIIVALIVSVVLPGKGQQKFWAKFLGQNIAYTGGGRAATFIIVLIVIIIGYILLRITPG
jgi:hypothetical protein